MSSEPIADEVLRDFAPIGDVCTTPEEALLRDLARALIEARGALRGLLSKTAYSPMECCLYCDACPSHATDFEMIHDEDCEVAVARALLPKPAGDA